MASYLLNRKYEITVFEKDRHIGGHANTVDVPANNGAVPVDTGFIVYNEINYPHFSRLMSELGVLTQPSDMSFGVHSPTDKFTFSSRGLRGLLSHKRNLLRPSFLRMITEIIRFNRLARRALTDGSAAGLSLLGFLEARRFSPYFIRYYISPMSSAIWSAAPGQTLQFPAETFIRFFHQHGLLSISPDIPWRTITGGSREYVKALTRAFRDRIRINRPVRKIRRGADHVHLSFDDGPDQRFDHVVVAAHADQALTLLDDPSDEERRALTRFPYQRNRVLLHNDASIMPTRKQAWAAWNVHVEGRGGVPSLLCMSYHMNRLQRISANDHYLVTLNPPDEYLKAVESGAPGARVFYDTIYEHPAYIAGSFPAQADLPRLNGLNRTWFCGAYFGYGFHEDGLKSGLAVARQLGVEWTL